MKLNKDLKTVYYFSVLCSVLLILVFGVQEYSDSDSYLKAWDSVSNGKIDILRTPVYPIFLGVCETIFGQGFFKIMAIVFQHLLFLLSITYFHRLAKIVFPKDGLSFWITMVYATLSCFNSLGNCILTESFAISGIVFLLYHSFKLYEKCSVLSALGFLFWLLFLIFLRPSFLYLLPVYLLIWVVCLLKKNVNCSVIGISCTLAVTVLQLFYIHQFNKEFGVLTPSCVSVINQFYMTRQDGLIFLDGIQNESLKQELKNSIELNGASTDDLQFLWEETTRIYESYPLKDVQQALSVSLKAHPASALRMIIKRVSKASSWPIFYTYLPGMYSLQVTLGVSIGLLFLVMAAYTLLMVFWAFRRRQIPWFSTLMYLLCVGNLATVIIGAQWEWSRLLLPSLPVFLLMFGQICSSIRIDSPLQIDFK